MGRITIIMYHYVRELRDCRFPEIKGLAVAEFKTQLKYLKKHYEIISMENVIEAVKNKCELPYNAALLTFDDGYIDHYINVFPILDENNVPGSFFPPAKAIENCEVLDVNKIHFLLASKISKDEIINEMNRMLTRYRKKYSLNEMGHYIKKLWSKTRFDSPQIAFIKTMLQRELPEKLRELIVDRLFSKYVTKDERAFSKELYMNLEMLKCMKRHRMYIGSHSYDHYWLNTLDRGAQKKEIENSLVFLKNIGVNIDEWVMCYPYGAYDRSLLENLKKYNCIIGLTTEVGIADFDKHGPLTLPRLDTNDFPKNNQVINKWTREIKSKGIAL